MSNCLTTMESRLTKLEHRNRLLTFVCLGLPCVAFFMGAETAESVWQGKKVTAEQFVLTNADGDVRAVLGTRPSDGGAEFVMLDQDGKKRLFLTATGGQNNTPGIVLLSKNERKAWLAGLNRDSGIGSVDFYQDGQFKGGVGGSVYHKE
ncbi:MAG: hypothetical protein KDA80_13055 [Planctomycetaceae bacterium]|nr:hypothetical protein [Planctomycetaceae bacterium]